MTRIFFDRTRVVREISAELKLLQRQQVMEIRIERDLEGAFVVLIKTENDDAD